MILVPVEVYTIKYSSGIITMLACYGHINTYAYSCTVAQTFAVFMWLISYTMYPAWSMTLTSTKKPEPHITIGGSMQGPFQHLILKIK